MDDIRFDVDKAVATLILNRPAKLNPDRAVTTAPPTGGGAETSG